MVVPRHDHRPMTAPASVLSVNDMNHDLAGFRRPLTVWVTVALLIILAFLSAAGGFIFNLSGADEPLEVLVGLVFIGLAIGYLIAAVRLPSGNVRYFRLAIALAAAHGLFNAVVKVGIEGETESAMFIVLAAGVLALLFLPRTRRFFDRRPETA